MTDSTAQIDFGHDLPDQLPTITAAISAQLSLETDVAAFLSERAALERDHAAKVQSLVRKYREKKAKRDLEISVGPTPTMEWKYAQSTLSIHITDLYTAHDASASHSNILATSLDTQSASMTASTKLREDLRKKYTSYAKQLLSDREKTYGEKDKAKAKYDDLCRELDSHRQKREKAESGDRHADRAAKAFQAAEIEMQNGKNSYLIEIAVSNSAKQRFYRHDLPAIQSSLQSLLDAFNAAFRLSTAKFESIVAEHHETVAGKHRETEAKASAVEPGKDQSLFAEYNQQRWQEPSGWTFEPCIGFFDNSDMSTEPAAVVFLQNRLLRCRTRIRELEPLVSAKAKEVDGLQNLRDAYQGNQALGNPDQVMNDLFEATRTLFGFEIELHNLTAEVETITATIGENQGQARPHRFKPASFTIPTACHLCGEKIWGLAKQGAVCKPCGYTVHQKCQMKVPAECKAVPPGSSGGGGGEVGSPRASASLSRSNRSSAIMAEDGRLQRSGSTKSATSSITPTSRFVPPPSKAAYDTTASSTEVTNGRVLYAFEASSPFEVSVAEGEVVELLEDDVDATGWIKIRAPGSARQGLVPTSYCDFNDQIAAALPAQDSAPAQGCGQFVKSLYDYAAQGPDEHSLSVGETIELTTLGFGYADG